MRAYRDNTSRNLRAKRDQDITITLGAPLRTLPQHVAVHKTPSLPYPQAAQPLLLLTKSSNQTIESSKI